MGRAHSGDLRERVFGEIARGRSRRAAAPQFGVSASTSVRLARRMAETGSLAPARQGRPPGGGKLAAHRVLLIDWVEADGDITMPELAARLADERQVVVHPASLSRYLRKAGYTVKKTLLASEAGREDVASVRRTWRADRQPWMRRDPYRLVFVDETGTTTKMVRSRGRTRSGERLKARAPSATGARRPRPSPGQALHRRPALRWPDRTLADRPADEPPDLRSWVESQLAPTLLPGDVVILDNLSSHKSEKAKAILKERGAWFLFLPPYSPDLNPIEMAFAKLEAHLRRIGARTIDALWRAVGSICEMAP